MTFIQSYYCKRTQFVMEKTVIVLLFVLVATLDAHLLKDNTHLEDWNLSKDLILKNEDTEENFSNLYIQNLTKIEIEDAKHHIVKVTRIKFRYFPVSNRKIPVIENDTECMESSSEDFPEDLFTMKQKRNGAIVLHFILGIYCFALLACVCNDYFLPSVEVICKTLNLSQDVAAATFMAIATSAPEFFVNIVGTFVTESDIGVGTIVGSSMFNTLGVAALGGLACKSCIQLDWWPITRDSIIYVLTVTMLVLMARDEKIEWYEALILLCFYVVYFIIMWQNRNIYKLILKIGDSFRRKSMQFSNYESGASSPPITTIMTTDMMKTTNVKIGIEPEQKTEEQEQEEEDEQLSLWHFPHTGSKLLKFWWVFSWPIRFMLTFTIPDCRKRPCMFPFTFIMCVVWIGSNSYMVSWMISVIGATFKIPDFVMGVTFLAAGGCLPEAISIVIVARKGQGGMGVSNSLGSNTLTILLSLGLPWFIKTMIGWESGQSSFIQMDSDSLFYTILALIFAVLFLYVTVSLNGYKLSKKVGCILILMYLVFLATAIALEMFLYYDGKVFQCEF